MYPTLVEALQRSSLPWLATLVPTPGFIYAIVAVVCTALAVWRLRGMGISVDTALAVCLAGAVVAIVGTRLYWLATRGGFGALPPVAWVGGDTAGTASWGAYLGAMAGAAGLAALRGLPVLGVLDALASFGPVACVIGRWNCFLNGDDFGRPTSLAWGVVFPRGGYAWRAQLQEGLIAPNAAAALPVHPTQLLLSAAAGLALIATSMAWRRRRRYRAGFTMGVFLVAYGGLRFPVEFLRSPWAGGAARGLSHSQWMCLAFVVAGIATGIGILRAGPPTNDTVDSDTAADVG